MLIRAYRDIQGPFRAPERSRAVPGCQWNADVKGLNDLPANCAAKGWQVNLDLAGLSFERLQPGHSTFVKDVGLWVHLEICYHNFMFRKNKTWYLYISYLYNGVTYVFVFVLCFRRRKWCAKWSYETWIGLKAERCFIFTLVSSQSKFDFLAKSVHSDRVGKKGPASLKTTNHMRRMCSFWPWQFGYAKSPPPLILRPDQCSQSQAISLADLIHEHLQDRCSILGLKLKWWINVSRWPCKKLGSDGIFSGAQFSVERLGTGLWF